MVTALAPYGAQLQVEPFSYSRSESSAGRPMQATGATARSTAAGRSDGPPGAGPFRPEKTVTAVQVLYESLGPTILRLRLVQVLSSSRPDSESEPGPPVTPRSEAGRTGPPPGHSRGPRLREKANFCEVPNLNVVSSGTPMRYIVGICQVYSMYM